MQYMSQVRNKPELSQIYLNQDKTNIIAKRDTKSRYK